MLLPALTSIILKGKHNKKIKIGTQNFLNNISHNISPNISHRERYDLGT
jgi:hypothetical protein